MEGELVASLKEEQRKINTRERDISGLSSKGRE
jgi:hypothetical protein